MASGEASPRGFAVSYAAIPGIPAAGIPFPRSNYGTEKSITRHCSLRRIHVLLVQLCCTAVRPSPGAQPRAFLGSGLRDSASDAESRSTAGSHGGLLAGHP